MTTKAGHHKKRKLGRKLSQWDRKQRRWNLDVGRTLRLGRAEPATISPRT
jgi:hypothetical protein